MNTRQREEQRRTRSNLHYRGMPVSISKVESVEKVGELAVRGVFWAKMGL